MVELALEPTVGVVPRLVAALDLPVTGGLASSRRRHRGSAVVLDARGRCACPVASKMLGPRSLSSTTTVVPARRRR